MTTYYRVTWLQLIELITIIFQFYSDMILLEQTESTLGGFSPVELRHANKAGNAFVVGFTETSSTFRGQLYGIESSEERKLMDLIALDLYFNGFIQLLVTIINVILLVIGYNFMIMPGR